MEFTCQESGIRESGVKQERATAEIEDSEMIHRLINVTSDDKGNIPMKDIKHEATSDDDNYNTQMSDNINRHNTHMLPYSVCINKYDNMIDIENDTQLLYDVKCDIAEMSGLRESGFKQERDSAEIEDSQMIHGLNKSTSDDERNIPMKDIKHEATSDDDNYNTQMSGNIECHNTQVLPYSEYINKYDDMIHIENDTQMLDDVKCDNVGDGIASVKRVKLNEDTESGPALKTRRPITSSEWGGNTGPAAAVQNKLLTGLSCPHCNYITANKNHLKAHSKMHSNRKLFLCTMCNREFTHKCNLKRHLLTHTGEKPFSCDKCHYKSVDKSGLKLHLLLHTGEKPFSCDKCNYKCIKKSHLKQHLLTHTGIKSFSCNKCNYKSIKKSTLKRHLFTHTNEKPFSCDKCTYKCIQKCHLKQHLLTHTGEKPFSCDKCDRKFTEKSILKHHLLTHAGEKPLSCDKCNFKCIQKGHLKRHLFTHTGE